MTGFEADVLTMCGALTFFVSVLALVVIRTIEGL